MNEKMKSGQRFDRLSGFFSDTFSYIGRGEPGGKASGLAFMQDVIKKRFPDNEFDGIKINIPSMTVLLSGVFEDFMEDNNLYEIALSDASDVEIALEFQRASLGAIYTGDLRSIIESIHQPLAIRSSSIFEDSIDDPFAGVYETKMIPNNQIDKDQRFRVLMEAIKFVYASLFFKNSKEYFLSLNRDIRDEKMAIIIQEVVGNRHGDLFYPTISGVVKSYNFYPTNNATHEEGIATLALGLGKTVVEGEKAWSYSPMHPTAPPPFNNNHDILKYTQTEFWSINMNQVCCYDSTQETEYLSYQSIYDAEEHDTLKHICSTFDSLNDRITIGTAYAGSRIIDFSPLLKLDMIPLNPLIKELMKVCEEESGNKVEMEFAMTIDPEGYDKPRFGFLQLRPISISDKIVDINEKLYNADNMLIKSEQVMGNAQIDSIIDIVFVKPDCFDPKASLEVAMDLAEINAELIQNKKQYLLMGFGRWGTSDPWMGVPIKWSQISGAKVIVEAILPQMRFDFSQGSHFFHNMTAHNVIYFSANLEMSNAIDWDWLKSHEVIEETDYILHVRTKKPIEIYADGRSGKGVILK